MGLAPGAEGITDATGRADQQVIGGSMEGMGMAKTSGTRGRFMAAVAAGALVLGLVPAAAGAAASAAAAPPPGGTAPAGGRAQAAFARSGQVGSDATVRVRPAAPVPAGIGGFNAAVVYNGQPQDFYWDQASGSLRHAWYTGSGWNFETLDGSGSTYPGATTDLVGAYSATVVYAGQLHVWYQDLSSYALRHAWWTGAGWQFESLDGAGTGLVNGRVADRVGSDNAVALYQGAPHVWYYDSTARTLRHAWWTGAAWQFETLDGAGGSGNGRVADNVGTYNAVLLYGGQPHLWYFDNTAGTLRHAWWNGAIWQFESLDGVGALGPGRTGDQVGLTSAVTLYGGQPHVWYADATAGTLRHAWWNGVTWQFENLDGPGTGATNGRTADTVGTDNSVALYGGQPHVWYLDYHAATLRHAWWNGATWQFETLDGTVVTQAPAVTGLNPTSGALAGGTSVTVTGSGFSGATAVSFGPTAAAFDVLSDGVLVARSPAGTGTVDVRVTGPLGASPVVVADRFSYVAAPTVTSITPATGPATGGTVVAITGTGLTGATAVVFGTTPATGVTVISSTQMTAVAPAGTGVVAVRVTGPGGTSAATPGDLFTYAP